MKTKYDLNQVGINTKLELHGRLDILRSISPPVLFLFDEKHRDNDSISQNIENAKTLVSIANVVLIGVEHNKWEEDNDSDIFGFKNIQQAIKQKYESYYAKQPKIFFDEMSKFFPDIVINVESKELSNEMIKEVGNAQDKTAAIKASRFNPQRSKYFIEALFKHYVSNSLQGNMILNCGRDHNTHIEEWINSGEIDKIVGLKVNYVRINTFDKLHA